MTTVPSPTPAAAEPAGPLLEVPDGVLAVLALSLPNLDAVTDGQARGADCVWCNRGPLLTETSIYLGEHKSHTSLTRFPRSCRPCAGERAYSGLFRHAPDCEECCAAAPGCEVGRVLNRLVREGRR
ncbi:hypothetical protein ACFYNZ_15280 [Streptomyces kebangsaanensis]|uniref:Uncharacterized protein n=1 Tax=Streptomyces kebangsaanensis TaxID=864058 RepID=A0ABW6KV84_9ACTN